MFFSPSVANRWAFAHCGAISASGARPRTPRPPFAGEVEARSDEGEGSAPEITLTRVARASRPLPPFAGESQINHAAYRLTGRGSPRFSRRVVPSYSLR